MKIVHQSLPLLNKHILAYLVGIKKHSYHRNRHKRAQQVENYAIEEKHELLTEPVVSAMMASSPRRSPCFN